jgi:dTDP-glucose 4,6-dehydratase
MKILVTGGAGFIGSNFIRHIFATTGHSVINVDKLSYAARLETLTDVMPNPRHSFERVDICDALSLGKVIEKHQPDAVVHLAAESHVDRSISGPGDFIRTNIVGTYELLQAAFGYWERLPAERQKTFRFLHASTDEVFGSLQPGEPSFHEATRYDPHSPYAASKAASDHLVRAWGHTYGLPVIITNCSNNYGPYQFPEKLVPLVILKALHGDPIPVYGTGSNIRDWIYVLDHVDAVLLALCRGKVGETYVIGGGNELSNIELVRRICGLMDELNPTPKLRKHEELITLVQERPGHDFRYSIDSSRTRRELGWNSREDAESGLRKTVEWYLSRRDWWEPILKNVYAMQRLGTVSPGRR